MLYGLGTVNHRGADKAQRWQVAIAIVGALSLFVALVAGSSMRPQFTAGALPEPAAWSQTATEAGVQPDHVTTGKHSQFTRHFTGGYLHGPAPMNNKPFQSMWMTKDRPTTWMRTSPQWGRSPLPPSIAASAVPPGSGPTGLPADPPADRDILTHICIARL